MGRREGTLADAESDLLLPLIRFRAGHVEPEVDEEDGESRMIDIGRPWMVGAKG